MKIGIFAPSDWFPRSKFDAGVKLIRSRGHELVLAPNLFAREADFMAGTVEERLDDLRYLIDQDVDILWAAEGGYAATEIRSGLFGFVDRLSSKLLVGYSDVTNLHNVWLSAGGVGLYAPTVCRLTQWSEKSVEKLFEIFDGSKEVGYEGGAGVIDGSAEGMVIAQNLECLSYCLGTNADVLANVDSDILLGIEEYKQDLSAIARQLDQVFDSTSFAKVKGVFLGRFCQLKEESYPKWASETSVAQMVIEKLKRRGIAIPVWSSELWGHETKTGSNDDFYPIINGSRGRLIVEAGGGSLKMEIPRHE